MVAVGPNWSNSAQHRSNSAHISSMPGQFGQCWPNSPQTRIEVRVGGFRLMCDGIRPTSSRFGRGSTKFARLGPAPTRHCPGCAEFGAISTKSGPISTNQLWSGLGEYRPTLAQLRLRSDKEQSPQTYPTAADPKVVLKARAGPARIQWLVRRGALWQVIFVYLFTSLATRSEGVLFGLL